MCMQASSDVRWLLTAYLQVGNRRNSESAKRQTLKLLSDFLHFTPQEVQNIELYGKDEQMSTILPTTEALAAHAL